MKRLTNFIRTSLSMSPAEAKGVITAFGLIGLLILLMFGADYIFSQKQQHLVISSPKMLDSLTVVLDNQQPSYDNNKYTSESYPSGNYQQKTFRNFNFDPNTATVAQLEELGLPKFIAERINKYRSKGGKFRKREDLTKIYGLLSETYERLEPYIMLPSAEYESTSTPQAEIAGLSERPQSDDKISTTPVQLAGIAGNKPSIKNNISKFDLNTADTTQLKMIYGIGSGFARRIVKFRDLLGGFANAEQVRETYGLPAETAEELLKYGFVKNGVKKLKVNQVAVTEFRHPYLKYFQAKAIIAYREQHGDFKSVEDLKQIKVLDETTLQKIAPYLEF